MKRISKLLLAFFIAFGFVLATSNEVEASEGFEINRHLVEMEVHEDGSVLVTETLEVEFSQDKHGIYVNIPNKYNMKWEINNETIYKKYNFPLRKVKVLSNHTHEIETFSSFGVRIKIGDPDWFAKTNETYKFQYEIVTKDLDLDGLQMLFMNIISGKWKANINHVEFNINMPKPFDKEKLLFDGPMGVTGESKGALSVIVSGNKISGTYSETLKPGEALTVQLMLDSNYFAFPDMNDYAKIAIGIGSLFVVLMGGLFYIFGKDEPLVETVEFHAPTGVTSAEVGVIIDGVANDGDVISLILDWGRRGVIKIIDNEKELKLVKLSELESTARQYEHTVFNRLFKKNAEEVIVDTLKERFYSTIQKAELQLDKYFDDKNRRTTDSSIAARIVAVLLSCVPIAVITGLLHYFYYFTFGAPLGYASIAFVTIGGATWILAYMEDKKYMHKWYSKILLLACAIILFAVPCVILVAVATTVKVSIAYVVIAIMLNIVVIIFAVYMKKRTAYGNELLGKVVGLRNFIIVAEQDRLQELLDENPYYFYDILPYAYALGLTNVWNEHFKNLTMEPCGWYETPYHTNPYYRMHSLESHMTSIERTLTAVPPSESSGGGSFSSGGSSGGFSGGGFGGSGGGSW